MVLSQFRCCTVCAFIFFPIMDRNCETLQNYPQFDGIAFKIERHPLKFDRTVQIFDKNSSNHDLEVDMTIW